MGDTACARGNAGANDRDRLSRRADILASVPVGAARVILERFDTVTGHRSILGLCYVVYLHDAAKAAG